MYKHSAIIAIAVLLNLFQLHNAHAATKSLKELYSYPQKQVMFNEYAFKDGNLVYAVCEETTKSEKICTVIQRQYPYDKVTRSCNVTLRPFTPENDEITDKVYVHAFGDENAILIWGEMGKSSGFDLLAIQLSSCKTKFLYRDDPTGGMLRTQIYAHRLVTYDNNFDLFAEPKKSPPAGSDDGRSGIRIGFDGEAQTLFNNFDINEEEREYLLFISPIATRSPAKGYVYSTTGKISYSLYLVKPNGAKKILTRRQEYSPSVTSACYDVITMCVKSESSDSQTTCTQYDENGDVKFSVTLDHDDKKTIRREVVHNSPRGGFLLMTAYVEITSDTDNRGKATSYEVIRVDGNGKKVGSVRLNGFIEEHENAKSRSLWENGNEYCAALIGQDQRDTLPADNLNIAVNCFTDNDFSA